MEDCAQNFKVQAEKIAGLQDRAGKFAGMLAAFCERLGWRDLEALIAKFQADSMPITFSKKFFTEFFPQGLSKEVS